MEQNKNTSTQSNGSRKLFWEISSAIFFILLLSVAVYFGAPGMFKTAIIDNYNITLSPTQGIQGTEVTVTGSGNFLPARQYGIYFYKPNTNTNSIVLPLLQADYIPPAMVTYVSSTQLKFTVPDVLYH